jgi:hypothetical protein
MGHESYEGCLIDTPLGFEYFRLELSSPRTRIERRVLQATKFNRDDDAGDKDAGTEDETLAISI